KGGEVGRCGCSNPFDRAHVVRMLACVADLDAKEPPKGFKSKAAAVDALKTARLLPSFVVDTGGGIHPYWVLDKSTTDLDAFSAVQHGIAKHFTSDPIIDPCRVVRLAGTENHKKPTPRPTAIISLGFDEW